MSKPRSLTLTAVMLVSLALNMELFASVHVYEVVEEAFTADKSYANPYLDVDLWVTLTGPGGTYRIPAFWDGGNTFRVRLVASAPGTWKWSTGKRTGDGGLDNRRGSFQAVAWSESEKRVNLNRRGFVRVASNQHTLEYADGTPFFYTGDTWWSALTKIYSWNTANCLAKISFQEAVALRKAQGFNGINIIACYPSDTIKGIWDKASHGQKVAEDGTTPFAIADPQDAKHGVDYTRINPAYWQQADVKWKHLWDSGFVPFMESVRRHEQWYSEDPAERSAFVNYIRYLWARYGCYNMIFSWVHWDWDPKVLDAWKSMVNMAYSALGEMPYGQPRTAMAWGSSLTTWRLEPDAVPLGAFDVHNVSNKGRDYTMYSWLRDIFYDANPRPGINVEPFYPGWRHCASKIPAGWDNQAMAQYQMYGSVLNGGFGGHAWGDTYYAGVATTPSKTSDISVPAGDPHRNGFNHWGAASMGKLKAFILDKGHDYCTLQPATLTHLVDTDREWRVLALSKDKSQGLGFFAHNKTKTDIKDLVPNTRYTVEWWDINKGTWSNAGTLATDSTGKLIMPQKQNRNGWAFRILRAGKTGS